MCFYACDCLVASVEMWNEERAQEDLFEFCSDYSTEKMTFRNFLPGQGGKDKVST